MISLLNKEPKILVIGDLIIDQYFWGSCDRVSPEAPVQVVNVSNETSVLGGAGNVLNNLTNIGCKVTVFGNIGKVVNLLKLQFNILKLFGNFGNIVNSL